jgi:hypothetical protein
MEYLVKDEALNGLKAVALRAILRSFSEVG